MKTKEDEEMAGLGQGAYLHSLVSGGPISLSFSLQSGQVLSSSFSNFA